jgi:hypothetical protein
MYIAIIGNREKRRGKKATKNRERKTKSLVLSKKKRTAGEFGRNIIATNLRKQKNRTQSEQQQTRKEGEGGAGRTDGSTKTKHGMK